MTRHAKPTRMLRPLNKRQWMKIAAVVAAGGPPGRGRAIRGGIGVAQFLPC